MALIRYLWCLLPVSGSCVAEKSPSFLLGNWQINEKAQFENWTKIDQQHYKGEVYEWVNDKRVIKERLSLTVNQDKLTYSAQVLNQNNGQTILFDGFMTESGFVVSNENHDFPQSIEYIKVSEDLIEAKISDKKGQGFTQRLTRASLLQQNLK